MTKACGIPECIAPGCALLGRADALIAANADRWRAGPKCEKCEEPRMSGGKLLKRTWADCETCWGTGGAGRLMGRWAPTGGFVPGGREAGAGWTHRVEYVRGMKRVHARAADVWEKVPRDPRLDLNDRLEYEPAPPEYRPTKWASAVCRHHPDVTELWVTDAEPLHGGNGEYAWMRGMDGTATNRVPEPVWDLLEGGRVGGLSWKVFGSADAARVALARAVPQWVRSFAG
jgi:hypothetical protein